MHSSQVPRTRHRVRWQFLSCSRSSSGMQKLPLLGTKGYINNKLIANNIVVFILNFHVKYSYKIVVLRRK